MRLLRRSFNPTGPPTRKPQRSGRVWSGPWCTGLLRCGSTDTCQTNRRGSTRSPSRLVAFCPRTGLRLGDACAIDTRHRHHVDHYPQDAELRLPMPFSYYPFHVSDHAVLQTIGVTSYPVHERLAQADLGLDGRLRPEQLVDKTCPAASVTRQTDRSGNAQRTSTTCDGEHSCSTACLTWRLQRVGGPRANRTLSKPLARHQYSPQVLFMNELTYRNPRVFPADFSCFLFRI